jgi:shikimate dehydrogenase
MTITGATKILGLIADPVVQARSPAMANALLAERDRFGPFVFLPLEVAAAGLADVVAAVRRIENFAGAVVSLPHKTAIVPLLDELTPEARVVGAVNVIRRSAGGRLTGTILDGEGFVAGLRSGGYEVARARCLLVGAGGAASAIAFALARHGVESLVIANRTVDKATVLAKRVSEAFPAVVTRGTTVEDAENESYDFAINATSVGMKPNNELSIPPAIVEKSRMVADCVVSPEMTPLLELAKRRDRTIHTGVPMLAAQMDLMLRFMGVE